MALSNHPAYRALRRAVAKNATPTVLERLASVDDTAAREALVAAALLWAFEADALQTFEALLALPVHAADGSSERHGGLMAAVSGLVIRRASAHHPVAEAGPYVAAMQAHGVSVFDPSALGAAVALNHLAFARVLLEAGYDPDGDYRGSLGSAKIHRCPPLCQAPSLAMVALLLKHKASLGAPPPFLPHGVLGGMGYVLCTWEKEHELGALWDLYVNAGGGFFTPMEASDGRQVPLAESVFVHSLDPMLRTAAQAQEFLKAYTQSHDFRMARFLRLQELFVERGFDVFSPGPHGIAWVDFVREDGSPRLQRKLALEALSAPPHPRRGPRL